MRKCLAVIAVSFVVLSAPALSQDWRQELSSDLVTISAGKMVFDEVGLVKIQLAGYEPTQFQVKQHSEAPHGGVISRDNFVALTSSYITILLLESLAQAYQVSAVDFLEGFDYTELQNPIGTADLELNLFMTDEGMQFEVVNTASGERMRHTMTWAEVYAK